MKNIRNISKKLGPGFVIAATGIGAGDMIAATVAGAKFGTVILWACLVGAIFKFVLNEGIARWQLSTGTSVLQAWTEKFKSFVSKYFVSYLFIWSFVVAAALMSACGLVAHTIFPVFSVATWGIIHSLLALALVWFGRYNLLEKIMKFFILMMFITIFANLFLMDIAWLKILPALFIPRVPNGSVGLILGVIGGVGGSVTILSYGYWLKEKKWDNPSDLKNSRIDLGISYLLTGLFGAAIIILSAQVSPEVVTGSKIVLGLADKLGETIGQAGRWVFLLGFWGAVFSSMLGVWNGIPYLFNDFIEQLRKKKQSENTHPESKEVPATQSLPYRIFLLFLAIPPIALLFLGKPVWIIIIYSISGAFFMPFLGVLLLFMNNRKEWIGKNKNSLLTNILLLLVLLLFVYLLFSEILKFV